MSSAIIHISGDVSNIQQRFQLKKRLHQSKKFISVENKKIPVYNLPISTENPSVKAIKKCILYLRKENITHILLSNKVEPLSVSTFLSEAFQKFDGKSVINYKIYDILRKYATENHIHLTDCSLLLYTDSPDKAKNAILKLYKHVRKIKIQTKNVHAFSELCNYFLEEYGLFIEVADQIGQADIKINLDNNDPKADLPILSTKSQILFSKGSLLVECKPYHEIDQHLIEFLIHCIYGMVSKDTIKRFFSDYPVRISKIKIFD